MLVVNNKPTRCFCLAIHLITSLLHGVVLLEKVTGSQLVKKFPTFYGTRRFNTAFIRARHLSLSCATSVQFMPPHPNSWRYHLILPSHLTPGFSKWFLSFRFPHQYPVYASHPPIYATCPAHLILRNLLTPTILGEPYRSLSLCGFFFHSPVTSSHLSPNTIQPMAYRILSHRQMSENFKSNWNYNNFLHLAVSVYDLMFTWKSYCLIATCFPHALSGVTHYHL